MGGGGMMVLLLLLLRYAKGNGNASVIVMLVEQ
jgi:hypothetical protein